MPRSRNKHSRAALRARSRRSRHQRSSGWFWGSLVVIVAVLGALLIFTVADSKSSNNAAAAPPQPPSGSIPGDHWHAAFAVNICGEWLPNPPTFEFAANNPNVQAGIHTHGDGFIHIHPYASYEAGSNATLGKFLTYGGWAASEDGLKTWTGPSADAKKTEWKNGDRCPSASGQAGRGDPGRVVWTVDCKVQSGNPSDFKLRDQIVIALGFLPKGQDLTAPPNAASAPSNDGTQVKPLDKKGCTPTAVNNPGLPDVGTTSPPGTAATGSGTTATTAPATTATTSK
jgi:hypothetical protein